MAWRRVHKLQIEASLACGLRCPGCSQGQQFKQRAGDKILSLARSELLFQAFAREGFALDWIEYCGQGEPLSHPHFDEIVSLGRRYLPGTRQRLITNGNYAFRNKIKTPLDEIIVSCDGYYPESYAQYRIGGSVERVLAFMADAVAESRGRTTVIWKYILLACNDSDAESGLPGRRQSPSVSTHCSSCSRTPRNARRASRATTVTNCCAWCHGPSSRQRRFSKDLTAMECDAHRPHGDSCGRMAAVIEDCFTPSMRCSYSPARRFSSAAGSPGMGRPWTDWRCAATAGRWTGAARRESA